MSESLLTEATVADYLSARGLLAPGERVAVQELPGGVSSVALLVRGASRALFVKQALPRLRVKADWRSDPRRSLIEAAALQALGRLTPASVPRLFDVDDERCALTMEALPSSYRTWKPLLLAEQVEPAVAVHLGTILARWHTASAADPSLREAFADREIFLELRVRPFFGTIAAVHPDIAARVDAVAERMLAVRTCLVHGDFSPKNVLVDGGGVAVVDCEVAHTGDPTFDLAFMLHHLALKMLARPAVAASLSDCAFAFLDSYRAGGGAVAEEQLVGQVACLMLARVDGKSTVDYLDAASQERVRAIVRGVLSDGARRLDELLATVRGGA